MVLIISRRDRAISSFLRSLFWSLAPLPAASADPTTHPPPPMAPIWALSRHRILRYNATTTQGLQHIKAGKSPVVAAGMRRRNGRVHLKGLRV